MLKGFYTYNAQSSQNSELNLGRSREESVSHPAADESASEAHKQSFVHGAGAQDHQAGGEQAGQRRDKRALITGRDKRVKSCHSVCPDTSGVDGTSCRNPGG